MSQSPADGGPDFLALALTPEFRDDPYPLYHRLRATDPVHRTPFGVWLLTRHADVAAVLRDPGMSNDAHNSNLQLEPPTSRRADLADRVMLFLDPPDHTRLRGLVAKAFTPRRMRRIRSRVVALVDGLLDAAVERGGDRVDVVADLAYPLPMIVICELLGVPAHEHPAFQEWSRELATSMDPQFMRSPAQEARIQDAATDFRAFFADLVRHRRRSPRDDLLSDLIAAEEAGDRLSEAELLSTGIVLLIAGHETTANLIGNGVLALLQHPDQLARLRDDPSLDRRVVEELLRFDSPIQLTRRIALTDHPVAGVTIPRGETVVALIGAANRDPDVFPDPDRLDLDREGLRHHIAFGSGAHFCLGAGLGRLQGEVAITTLVRRFGALELTGPPARARSFTFRGLQHLPVAVRR